MGGFPVIAKEEEQAKCVALGDDVEIEVVEVEEPRPQTPDERLGFLEQRLIHMTNMLDSLFAMVKDLSDTTDKEKNEEINKTIDKKKADLTIPVDTILTGNTKGLSYFLQVRKDGFYVGETKHESLSAAAEVISGTRRSGWTFWKLPDGRTVKEVFKE